MQIELLNTNELTINKIDYETNHINLYINDSNCFSSH